MKQIRIQGGNTLSGNIQISGAKNSAVALVPASLLSDGIVTIDNVPSISDIDALNDILEYLGAKVSREGNVMKIDPTSVVNKEIPELISKRLRASYYFMAALLGKYKKVEMYFPGGCSIGARPIDQTLKAFKALGATIVEKDDKYTITADELVGSHIYLDMPSVGATVNTLLAAVKAKGKTIIENAAKEPEIVSVATFLNTMGAKITGAGTSQIKIIVEKGLRCPVCDKVFKTKMIKSGRIKRMEPDKDLRPRHEYIDTLKSDYIRKEYTGRERYGFLLGGKEYASEVEALDLE